MQISANFQLSIVNHKNRWVAAFTHGWDYEFNGCDTLNRTRALQMISFLSDYVNLVQPTDETILNASLKAKTNGIRRDVDALTALALKKEDKK